METPVQPKLASHSLEMADMGSRSPLQVLAECVTRAHYQEVRTLCEALCIMPHQWEEWKVVEEVALRAPRIPLSHIKETMHRICTKFLHLTPSEAVTAHALRHIINATADALAETQSPQKAGVTVTSTGTSGDAASPDILPNILVQALKATQGTLARDITQALTRAILLHVLRQTFLVFGMPINRKAGKDTVREVLREHKAAHVLRDTRGQPSKLRRWLAKAGHALFHEDLGEGQHARMMTIILLTCSHATRSARLTFAHTPRTSFEGALAHVNAVLHAGESPVFPHTEDSSTFAHERVPGLPRAYVVLLEDTLPSSRGAPHTLRYACVWLESNVLGASVMLPAGTDQIVCGPAGWFLAVNRGAARVHLLRMDHGVLKLVVGQSLPLERDSEDNDPITWCAFSGAFGTLGWGVRNTLQAVLRDAGESVHMLKWSKVARLRECRRADGSLSLESSPFENKEVASNMFDTAFGVAENVRGQAAAVNDLRSGSGRVVEGTTCLLDTRFPIMATRVAQTASGTTGVDALLSNGEWVRGGGKGGKRRHMRLPSRASVLHAAPVFG